MRRRLPAQLNYANVIATIAMFVALGGTGYALTLPRDSVGTAQIRTGAVASGEVRDRSLRARDLSAGARDALRGRPGPAGPPGTAAPTYRAAITAGGGRALGNATASAHAGGSNVYTVEFAGDVSACVYSAVLAAVQSGPQLEQPPAGRITVASGGGGRVTVQTFGVDGSPTEAPFHLSVSC